MESREGAIPTNWKENSGNKNGSNSFLNVEKDVGWTVGGSSEGYEINEYKNYVSAHRTSVTFTPINTGLSSYVSALNFTAQVT